ncbi:hypothetical protein [Rhodovulum sulfidophilum]|uniref:hypothetical protein n=1 Tax=Rhodovulum sulfidophilum TaxID=35806 RepID=UPI00138A4331|nr:hypothetical protein [Rhodovulum sulfidophilum]NDK34665.1 hypothetical protein [Rhodovulum sulfidophilum]
MQILAACGGTMREQTRIARANSVQLFPLMCRDMTKENAAAAGPRNGAQNACEASQLPEKDTSKTSVSATLKYPSDAHQWAARLLAAALPLLEDFGGWAAASALWAARLTARERALLAYAALRSLEPEQAEMTAATVLRAAGAPMPPFLRGME